MPDDKDRPSTETEETPTPPKGQNIKALVTPGDDAVEEAQDEEEAPPKGGADDNAKKPNGELPSDAPASITGLAG